MKLKKVYKNLSEYYNHHYLSLKLVNPRFYFDDSGLVHSISWPSFEKHFDEDYESYFDWVVNNGQYSLQIDDEALIQITYEGNSSNITKSSLAFLPFPGLNYSYFRFDYDVNSAKDYYHSESHIHFGYSSSEMRLSLYHFPMPSEFLDFVLFLLKKKEIDTFKGDNFFSDVGSITNCKKYNHIFRFKV